MGRTGHNEGEWEEDGEGAGVEEAERHPEVAVYNPPLGVM